MAKIRVLLVDDERLMCDELKSQLDLYPEIETLAVCHNGEDALARAADLKPDVVFLDIQMPGISGMSVADVLSRQTRAPKVVFLTAHDQYAVQAFAVDAVDYVLKPFDDDDIKRVVVKLKKLLHQPEHGEPELEQAAETIQSSGYLRRFCVQQGAKLEVVCQEQIQLIYAKERLVFVQTTDGASLLVKFTLNEIVSRLDPKLFVRCHRNYVVNVEQIKNLENWFNRGYLIMLKGSNKAEVPVSRQYVKDLKQYMEF